MFKPDLKLWAGAALVSALLVGCGGDSGGNSGMTPTPGPGTPVQQTITGVADFVRGLFSSTSDSALPIDVNAITLVPNDQVAPAAVN